MPESMDIVNPAPQMDFRVLSTVLLERLNFFRQAGITYQGHRDSYEILGYNRVLTYRDYRARYMRGGIAKRIVEAYPKATWRGGVELYEDEDPEASTQFEREWDDLEKQLGVWARLLRADILAGLSTYSVLLIGAPGDLSTPLPKGKPGGLLYLQPFSGGGGPGGDRMSRSMSFDADASIMDFVTDAEDKRFGEPQTYQLRRTNLSAPLLQRPVHQSRIIHIAEGLLGDEVYGAPVLENVWNLMDDLDKVTGGGAEAFWLRANPGLHLNVDKDMDIADHAKVNSNLKEQAEEYANQITRLIRTRGVDVTPLTANVADFQNPADAILTQIAGAKGIPKRLLLGSEMGQLASGQDRDNWDTAVTDRRTSYAGPNIVRRLVDRLIEYGYLSEPKQYNVEWPVIENLTEVEKADLALKLANVNKTYGTTVFTDDEIRDRCYRLPPRDDKDPVAEMTEPDKAAGALKWAMTNKAMGITVYTDDEIREHWSAKSPLPASEKVPIGAPEKISVTKAPPVGVNNAGEPVDENGNVVPAEPALAAAEARMLAALEEAIGANDGHRVIELLGVTG